MLGQTETKRYRLVWPWLLLGGGVLLRQNVAAWRGLVQPDYVCKLVDQHWPAVTATIAVEK